VSITHILIKIINSYSQEDCVKILLSVALLLYSLAVLASLPNGRHIFVEGTAQVSATPDIAILYLSVEVKKETALLAKNSVDKTVNDFLKGLELFRINEKDVSASNISTTANYYYTDDDKQELDGFIAKRSLKVTLKNIESLDDFMNFALSVKINEIKNIEFQSSKHEELKNAAMSRAVKNAQGKAQSMAEAFGASLGSVYSINSENQSHRYRYGSNDSFEKIQVTGTRIESENYEAGKYLRENIIYSATVKAVFDLKVD